MSRIGQQPFTQEKLKHSQLSPTSVSASVDAFLILGDGPQQLKGESQDHAHKDAIDIRSFRWIVENGSSIGSGTSGAGAGRANFSKGFQLTKLVDSASPKLFQACASGHHFSNTRVIVRKAGGKPLEYIHYHFRDVFITSLLTILDPSLDLPYEELQFVFAALEDKYVPQDEKGGGKAPIIGVWNIMLQQASFS
jgi:type VI secretion system secreted protein Hcp